MYKLFVHLRHPDHRLEINADAPFPAGASEDDWRLPIPVIILLWLFFGR